MNRQLLRWASLTSALALTATVALAAPANANLAVGSISGTFTSSTGTPVPGQATLVTTDDDYVSDVNINAAGNYVFPTVRAGSYKVSFRSNSGIEQWAYQQRSFDTAAVITVTDGANTVVNDSLMTTGTITGRLTDQVGAPLSAWVTANDDRQGTVAGTYTDPDGRYSLAVLPGDYKIQLYLELGFRQWIPQQQYEETAQAVTVTSGGTVVADDVLVPTGSIAGRVVDAAGQPAPNLDVSTSIDNGRLGPSAYTDENGNYLIPHAFPGDYQIEVRHPNGTSQWAHGQVSRHLADSFTVTVGNQTTVNETLLGSGSVAGRLVDSTGAGVAGADVTVSDGTNVWLSTSTDHSGDYRIDDVLAGDDYTVSFTEPTTGRTQYAYGVGNSEDAAKIAVQANATTTVNDTLLAPGTLRVTATDSTSGAPLAKFCAWLNGPSSGYECTTSSEILFPGVGAGRYDVGIYPDTTSLYMYSEGSATVTPGTTADLAVPVVLGGAVTTTVTDRATGAPVADVCVSTVEAGSGRLPDGEGYCSNSAGQLRIKPLEPGDYHVFVRPRESTGLGAQWLGANGGTGAASSAKRITVTAGATTAAPAVLLDPAGAITGVVRGADNTPRAGVGVALSSIHPGVGGNYPVTDQNGRYTVRGLGPYAWPLFFMDHQHARQWSGGTANRMVAQKIQVTSGATATYDIRLKTGTVITGSIRDRAGQPVPDAYLMAHSALTQDIIGIKWENGDTYEMRVLAPELVKVWALAYVDDQEVEFWYDNGTDFASARTVAVPAQGRTLDLVVPIN